MVAHFPSAALAASQFVSAGTGAISLQITGGSGQYRWAARFRGRSLDGSGTTLNTRSLREGRGVIVITVLDEVTGAKHTIRQGIIVDFSAPRTKSRSYTTTQKSACAKVVDRWSKPAKPMVSLTANAFGSSVVRTTLADKAGNTSTAKIRVNRRISLSRPRFNDGISGFAGGAGTAPTGSDISKAFAWNNAAGWYLPTKDSPELINEVSWRLKKLGYMSPVYKTGNVIDYRFVESVKKFQRANGIPAIATVGPDTRRALDAAIEADDC